MTNHSTYSPLAERRTFYKQHTIAHEPTLTGMEKRVFENPLIKDKVTIIKSSKDMKIL